MMKNRKTGVYLLGALGSISTTVVAGVSALRKRLIPPTGMVTAIDIFDGIELAGVEDFVFGGCDIRDPEANQRDIFEKLAPVHPRLVLEIEEDVKEYLRRIDIGSCRNCGEAIQGLACHPGRGAGSIAAEIDEVRGRLRRFRQEYGLDRVIVVNLASTEPPIDMRACHADPVLFRESIERDDKDCVRASTIYAYASVLEGCPYINFTPSNGALIPAIVRLAQEKGVPVMGNDGKTGETLVKSALAPMFASRNLEVMSWRGFNILGNMDGQVLENPGNKASKIMTKDRVVSKILGYAPHTGVNIDYVPSLDDQKTAWDFIHFRGFLGAKMSVQFIWQGYDSILAAPLVLDLVRLAELAARRGEAGLMPHLASFFKAPAGVDAHALPDQFRMLVDYAAGVKAEGGAEAAAGRQRVSG